MRKEFTTPFLLLWINGGLVFSCVSSGTQSCNVNNIPANMGHGRVVRLVNCVWSGIEYLVGRCGALLQLSTSLHGLGPLEAMPVKLIR